MKTVPYSWLAIGLFLAMSGPNGWALTCKCGITSSTGEAPTSTITYYYNQECTKEFQYVTTNDSSKCRDLNYKVGAYAKSGGSCGPSGDDHLRRDCNKFEGTVPKDE